MRQLVTFADTLLTALVVGAMFGIWLGGNPVDLPPESYVRQQQHTIRALNVTMPVLGWSAVLLTLVTAWLARGDRRRVVLLVTAVGCLMAAGGVTRFLNQPINAVVMTWSSTAPPEDWGELRDEWWRWHILRTALGVGGLALLIGASLVERGRTADPKGTVDEG